MESSLAGQAKNQQNLAGPVKKNTFVFFFMLGHIFQLMVTFDGHRRKMFVASRHFVVFFVDIASGSCVFKEIASGGGLFFFGASLVDVFRRRRRRRSVNPRI